MLEIKLGVTNQSLLYNVLVSSFGLPPQWRQGMECHVIVHGQGILMDLVIIGEHENGQVGLGPSAPYEANSHQVSFMGEVCVCV